MVQKPDYLRETPSQTAGPYVHIGLAPASAGLAQGPRPLDGDPAGPGAPGERIEVAGRILDGTGTALRDALIETWQADAAGVFHATPTGDFRGWGRVAADAESGEFRLATVKPGAAAGAAPHIAVWIVARGINTGLQTRMYFPEEAAANAADPVLAQIAPAARRATLIAAREGGGPVPRYRFDIRLQGTDETVFLDI